MSEPHWVKLVEVVTRMEGEVIKEALEAQGIPVEILRRGGNSVYPVSFGPLEGAELHVPDDHLAKAQAWLAEYDSGELEDELSGDDEAPDEEEDEEQ